MKRTHFMLFAIFIAAPFLVHVPVSYSFDCAKRGATMSMVARDCGEPTWVDRREEGRLQIVPPGTIIDGWYIAKQSRLIQVPVDIEEWTYNLGSTRFMRILTFENGILVSIKTGGYGR